MMLLWPSLLFHPKLEASSYTALTHNFIIFACWLGLLEEINHPSAFSCKKLLEYCVRYQ